VRCETLVRASSSTRASAPKVEAPLMAACGVSWPERSAYNDDGGGFKGAGGEPGFGR
jgi:hypothetical protein